jgi:sulfur carrier protein
MQLTINGKEETVSDVINILDLLKVRGIETPEMVSVELNNEILNRADFESTQLKDNDQIEFLFFMGGGQSGG